MKTDCIQIHTKRKTLDVLYTINENGDFIISPKPIQDLLLSHIFFNPKSRHSLIVLNGAKHCTEFKKYMIVTVEKEYSMKPMQIYANQVNYHDTVGEIHVYIINGNSKSYAISMLVDFIYLDSTIKSTKIDAIKKITFPLLHAKGSFMVDNFTSK